MSEESKDIEIHNTSTKAENLRAWKELMSSNEAKEFISIVLEKSTVLFGQTSTARFTNTISNILLMVIAFLCVGALGFLGLVPEGTTGVLAGIIIGYFFKRNE